MSISAKKKIILKSLTLLFLIGCATKGYLKIDNAEKVLKIDEYDKKLQVTEIPGQISPTPSPEEVATPIEQPITEIKKAKPGAKSIETVEKERKIKEQKLLHEKTRKKPALEDNEGFVGRRPLVDPFRVGEKTTLKVTYFNVSAGELTMEVRPYVQVNGRNSYHFFMTAVSNSLFSKFYSINDSAETFLDYELMIPYNMAVHVKESKQLREVRAFFDWKKLTANFWEKKVTDKGVEEKDKVWDIPEYSQNIISAAFYMRTFQYKVGKEIKFRLADEKKNMVVTAKTIRKEKLETDIGTIDTIVIQPEIAIEGIFKPIGEVFFWLTDDERKFVVRMESKIKIGKVIAKLKDIQR